MSSKSLALRVNPAIGAPGGMVAVVLRTSRFEPDQAHGRRGPADHDHPPEQCPDRACARRPFQVEAGGATVQAGGVAELGVNTFEPFAVSGGRFTLTWDPQVAGGPPTVKLDPRYGQSSFTVDTSQPGRLVVDFTSPDASFNSVPGTVVGISLPVDAGAAVGATSPFTLDPAESWLLDPQGAKIGLALQNGVITI